MSLTPIPTTEITKVTRDPRERIHQEAYADKLGKYVIYTADKSTFTYDAEGEKEIDEDALFELFIDGVVCLYDDVYYAALTYDEDNGIAFAFPAVPDPDDQKAEG